MTDTLDGQVAWITGAGSGIGRACSIALAKSGARVVLSDRDEANLVEAADVIERAGGQPMVAVADMSDSAAVNATAARIAQHYGRCDILVNAAGINVSRRAWDVVDVADFDEVVAIDLNGCFYGSRAVLPIMRSGGGGLLIHLSSWGGRYVMPLFGPAYNAAKHGLVALSESLNQAENVNGIRSCCLCPAEVATPILDQRPTPVSSADRARMLQPQDIADLVLYVATAPKTVCINEVLLSPTWNRAYV